MDLLLVGDQRRSHRYRWGLAVTCWNRLSRWQAWSTPSLLPSQQSRIWIVDLATSQQSRICCQVNNPESGLLTWQQRGCGFQILNFKTLSKQKGQPKPSLLLRQHSRFTTVKDWTSNKPDPQPFCYQGNNQNPSQKRLNRQQGWSKPLLLQRQPSISFTIKDWASKKPDPYPACCQGNNLGCSK